MSVKKKHLCRCHPDFHIPGDAIVGKDFDGVKYAKRVKASGVDSLVFFAKCHYGFSYYPTEYGTVHPGLQKDMLGEFVKGCREADLGVTCYYSVFLDTQAIKKHPDWMLRSTKQAVSYLMDNKKYLPVCVNSGYLDELLIPQALEIIEKYDVDELFYDTMSDFTPCYCDNCRRLFGKPIPEDSSDPNWMEYVHWYYKQYEEFFAKTVRVIHEHKPDVQVLFNWSWSARQPDMPAPYIKHLVGDLFTSGAVASYYSHYWAGTGYPFDYMCGRFLHGLGDWTNATPETLKYTGAATIANGGGFYLIDRQRPDGTLEERSYAMLKEVFSFIQERRDVVEGTVHVPETAVLQSFEHIMGPELEYFPDADARKKRMRQLDGVAKMFMTQGKHYTALNSENLNKRMNEYKLLVLPEVEYLSDDTKAGIQAFVENGGKLLVVQSGNEAAIDMDILELAGADYEGFTNLKYSYVENYRNGVEDPILARGKFALIKPKNGATTVARLIAPLTAGKGGAEFGHGFAPATGFDGHAAVIRRSVGKGEVIYAAGPLFTSYETYLNPHITKLVLELYDMLMPSPLVKVKAPAQVEMTAMRKDDDLIVHLVNHSGHEVMVAGWLPVTEYIPELHDIKLSIRASKDGQSVVSAPDGTVMETVCEDGYMKFIVPSLEIMRSFRIAGYFA